MSSQLPAMDEQTGGTATMTELTIAPDGRVFVFGTSRPILEVLEALQPRDAKLRRLLEQVRGLEAAAAAARQERSGT